jgi:hypothetical protein
MFSTCNFWLFKFLTLVSIFCQQKLWVCLMQVLIALDYFHANHVLHHYVKIDMPTIFISVLLKKQFRSRVFTMYCIMLYWFSAFKYISYKAQKYTAPKVWSVILMRKKYLDYEVLKIADENIFCAEFVVWNRWFWAG